MLVLHEPFQIPALLRGVGLEYLTSQLIVRLPFMDLGSSDIQVKEQTRVQADQIHLAVSVLALAEPEMLSGQGVGRYGVHRDCPLEDFCCVLGACCVDLFDVDLVETRERRYKVSTTRPSQIPRDLTSVLKYGLHK